MTDAADNAPNQEPSDDDTFDEATSAVNSQITDAVKQINASILGNAEALGQAMAQQIMSQSIALAMQNAVAQQQQMYTLRNAVTAAAVKAILEASPEEALQFAREALSGEDVVQTLSSLKDLMDSVSPSGGEAEGEAAKAASSAASAATAATTSAEPSPAPGAPATAKTTAVKTTAARKTATKKTTAASSNATRTRRTSRKPKAKPAKDGGESS